MTNEKKSNLSEDYLREFRLRAGYVINEAPNYRPLVGTNEEFDEVPVLTNESGEQENAPKPEGQVPPEPSNDVPQDIESPVPAFDAEGGEEGSEAPVPAPMDDEVPPAPADGAIPPTDPMGVPPEPENDVNNIQNDIIKHNIEAMRDIHGQLEGLESVIQGLNSKMDTLSADVEEVREPTSAEKLLNKSNVSYPYYFNLNDMWEDNWFDQQRSEDGSSAGNNEREQGIKELPDGSYVADFDDLPQKSKNDVQDSFNDII